MLDRLSQNDIHYNSSRLGQSKVQSSFEQNRCNVLRILGEQKRKRGEREALVACEGRIAKIFLLHIPHTIVQAVPAFKYERSYPIGYFPYVQ